jgi:hypothetical protein
MGNSICKFVFWVNIDMMKDFYLETMEVGSTKDGKIKG